MPYRLSFAAVISLVALLSSGAPLIAQDEPTAEATAAEEAPEPIPPELASARATMRTFLEAFTHDDESLEDAARCLDLSRLRDDVRDYKGKELAWQLKQIIDRTQFIVFEDISADPAGEPYVLPVKDLGEIVIGPDEDGVWRFTAATVDAVPGLFEATRDTELIEGVTRSAATTPAMWLRSKLPASLLSTAFLLENWQWLGLLLLIFLGMVVDRLLIAAVQAAIERYLARRMESIDKDELREALRPIGLLAAALLWWPGIFWLGLPVKILEVLVVAVKFVAATAFVWAAYRLVDVASAVLEVRASRSTGKFDDLLVPLLRKSAKIFVVAFGLVFIADTLNLPITSVVAGLGIGGLAVALAAQDAVKNLFGSLVVILDRPFSVGDSVKVGGVEGDIAELGFRSTRIRAYDGTLVTLANGNLISATIENLSERPARRWKTMLSLTYDTPAEKIEAFCEGVRELIRLHPLTNKNAIQVYMHEFAASSLDVHVQLFFETTVRMTELECRHRLALDILRLAADLGVEFAFPTQTVYLQQPAAGDAPGSDGYRQRMDAGVAEARALAGRLAGDGAASTDARGD